MKYKFSADTTTYTSKPNKNEAARISNQLEPVFVNSIEDFIDCIQRGSSWTSSLFNGPRSNKNWIGQGIFALDFDGGISPEEAIERLKAYDITPNAWYPTFGDTPGKRKFRLIFFIDTFIIDIDARNYIMKLLLAFYHEADKACQDPAHFFYGTNKEGQVLNPKALSLDLLLSVLESDKLKDGGRSRKIDAQTTGAAFLRKIGENCVPYSNIIGDTKKATNEQQKIEYCKKLKENKRSKNIEWEKLQKKVKLFYDFMNGEVRLTYAQLLGLAQNLVWMKGGQKLYEDRLQEFNANHKGDDPYPNDGRFQLIRSLKKYNKSAETAYFPQKLENFSPYPEDHKYRNLLTAERDLLDGIEQIEPIHRISLDKAEQLFEYEFTQAMDCLSDDIFIFRLPTGLGKTHKVKDLKEVTLAFPTNDLKQEIFGERKIADTAIMTPEFPVFTDDKLNESIERLYKAGFIKQVHRLLFDFKKGLGCDPEDQRRAQLYIDQNQAVQKSIHSIFTTHTRAIHSTFTHDTIIFDEDPLSLLLNVDTLKIADLKKIKKQSKSRLFGNYSTQLITLQRYLESVDEGEILTLPDEFKVDITNEWLLIMQTEGIDSNIIKFLDCTYFYKDESDRDRIHFINQQELPKDKKIIILSATIPFEIYKKLYGERVNVIDITDVTHKGRITQHTRYSYSRNSLKSRLDEANSKLSKRPTITFKSFNDSIQDATPDMWFGNCSGYNQYTGQSINVVGCPHKHNAQYLLIGKVLGENVDQFNREFKLQPVEWGGFRFNFNTFTNKGLQKIQLSLIESELIQAAGRARALREDVEVDIYANLPLRITKKFVAD